MIAVGIQMRKIMNRLFYTWDNFDHDVLYIIRQLHVDKWMPDYVVGVKRGGLIPAVKISHILNKPLIMMSCQLRDSNDNEVRLYEVEELPKDRNILIVDDMCDSGGTLSKIIVEFIAKGFDVNHIKTCSLIFNKSQSFMIDYRARIIDRDIEDGWIIFPWEKDT